MSSLNISVCAYFWVYTVFQKPLYKNLVDAKHVSRQWTDITDLTTNHIYSRTGIQEYTVVHFSFLIGKEYRNGPMHLSISTGLSVLFDLWSSTMAPGQISMIYSKGIYKIKRQICLHLSKRIPKLIEWWYFKKR